MFSCKTFSLGKLFSVLMLALTISACSTTPSSSENKPASDTRTTQQKWADNNLEFEAASLSNKGQYKGTTRVAASAYRGTVLLFGQASTDELQKQFGEDVAKIKGVKDVRNQVRVKPMLTVAQSSTDTWITTKVKSALISKGSLKGTKIKVITEDKEVFLLGYVDRESAAIAAEVASNVQGVKSVVKAFVLAD